MVEGERKWDNEIHRPINTPLLLEEIGFVVSDAVAEGRDELNPKEIEYLVKIAQGLINECKIESSAIPHLLPEEISEETANHILKKVQQ